jgi:hypothetical protein
MYYGTYEGHVYKRCTDKKCDDCDGRGEVLDAPADVLSGHPYMTPCDTCGGRGHHGCSGCRAEGLDCWYEALSFCDVCGGMEGALLPVCPGVMLTAEQHDANYAHYCAGSGPFAHANLLHDVTEARVFAERYVAEATCNTCGMERENEQHLAGCPDDCGAHDFTSGARHFYDAVNELWQLIHGATH